MPEPNEENNEEEVCRREIEEEENVAEVKNKFADGGVESACKNLPLGASAGDEIHLDIDQASTIKGIL